MNVPTIDLKFFARRTRCMHRRDFCSADPYGLRIGVLTTKDVLIKHACLTIELQPRSSKAHPENFFINLTPAFSNRTIWSFRHRPSYWRIEPPDIPNFRRLQALMDAPDFDERFQHADLRAYTRRVRTNPAMPRTVATLLYLQLSPESAFTLLSRNAYQPISLMFEAGDWSRATAV